MITIRRYKLYQKHWKHSNKVTGLTFVTIWWAFHIEAMEVWDNITFYQHQPKRLWNESGPVRSLTEHYFAPTHLQCHLERDWYWYCIIWLLTISYMILLYYCWKYWTSKPTWQNIFIFILYTVIHFFVVWCAFSLYQFECVLIRK